ncbi:uncharacterized protein LOC122311798 [Carya illinoinensis]|uniref:uncharacterized protein LOC122311798 n=1 Tax=Carya illinoinensis TaxID=32201 RepID=UPI001C726CE7|nr:uncharacterized protein LOC122311798 [Carya illinoinensis]
MLVVNFSVCRKGEANGREGLAFKVVDLCWSPPSDSSYKLNFDATFDSEKKLMGIGIVVRNYRGEAMIVVTAPRSHLRYAYSAECYALIRSIKLCREMRLQQVVIEGDAKSIIEDVIGQSTNSSWQGILIEDIKYLLKGMNGWKLSFVRRGSNKVAHIAAKLGMCFQILSQCGLKMVLL